MNESAITRARWPSEMVERYSVSPDTRHFLRTIGLPEFIPGMTLEFGVFDSQDPNPVIGQDDEFPISIDSATDAVFVADSSEEGRCFINSSVRLLDRFIDLVVLSPPTSRTTWSDDLRKELATIDPRALDEAGHCLWPAIIDRFQLNIS